MKEYKIKVANEAESKEAQELFFELGYEWLAGKMVSYTENPFLFAYKDKGMTTAIGNSSFIENQNQEITLPQLRDLAVLHRNDVSDATHTFDGGKYYIGNKVYFWDEEKWVNCSASVQYALEKCTTIKKEEPQMTWQDALRAVADGKQIQCWNEFNKTWLTITNSGLWSVDELSQSKLRLAPQRKELNGNFTKEELLKIAGEMV